MGWWFPVLTKVLRECKIWYVSFDGGQWAGNLQRRGQSQRKYLNRQKTTWSTEHLSAEGRGLPNGTSLCESTLVTRKTSKMRKGTPLPPFPLQPTHFPFTSFSPQFTDEETETQRVLYPSHPIIMWQNQHSNPGPFDTSWCSYHTRSFH